MLGEDLEPARRRRLAIQGAVRHRPQRRAALQVLEAVGGDQDCPARAVQPVAGAADALDQPAHPLRRADLDDEIDRGPIDAEVQRRGGDHRAEPARGHRRLDLAPLFRREASVVQRDRQVEVVEPPELLETDLRLRPGVDEDDGGPRLADLGVDQRQGVHRHVSGPGDPGIGRKDFDLCRGPGFAANEADVAAVRHRRKPCAQRVGISHRRRQRHPSAVRRQRLQPGQPQRQEVAALAPGQGVQLVDDDAAKIGEQPRCVRVGQEQRQGLRRRHQELRRARPLPLALALWRVAGSRLGAEAQPHLRDRLFQVAVHVDGQGLERRDVEGVQPVRSRLGQFDQRRQEARQGLAAAGGRDQEGVAALDGRLEHRQLVVVGPPAARGEPGLETGG